MESLMHHEASMPSSFSKSKAVIGGALVLVAIFAYGAVMTLLYDHNVWGTSNEIPWGMLISGYIYFAVGCTGLCLLSTLGHRVWIYRLLFGESEIFQTKAFEEMGIRPIILAIVSMITGFFIIALELKYPLNLVIHAVLSPNLQSAFIWMGLLYSIYLVFLIAEVFFYIKKKIKVVRTFAILAILTGVAATSNLGSVMGAMHGRDFWTTPFLPIMFIVSALVTGTSALVVLFYFTNYNLSKINKNQLVPYLSKLMGLFISVSIFLTIWNMISGYIGQVPGRYEATMYLLTGPLKYSFWVFEVGIGLVMPLTLILFFSDSHRSMMIAGVMALVGLMFARHNLMTAGQVVALQPDSTAPVTLLSYVPTVVELSMMVGAFGLIILGYIGGEKLYVYLSKKIGSSH